MVLTWSGLSVGWRSSSNATAPETTPVAIEEPLSRKYVAPLLAATTWSGSSVSRVLPGTRSDTIRRPGAIRSGLAVESTGTPQAENQASRSSAVVRVAWSSLDPTVIAYGSTPGVTTL